MSSDELDPKLEATTRLFTGDLEEFFRRDVLDKARRYSADTADISEMIEALPDEEVRDEQGLLARSRELQALEVLLERVRRATRLRVHRRFCRCANDLKDERIRGKVARAFVERVSLLIDQLFASFDVSERAESWTAELERWLVCELQRITDEEIIRTASPGSGTTDQKAVDQRTQQIGDRVVSHLPPRSGTPAQQTDQGGSQINIATLLTTPWKRFIARIMLDHPDYSNEQICSSADRRRNSRREGETKKELAPPVPWMKASGETRRPEEYLLDEGLWVRVYENDKSRHALESEFSKIRRTVKLDPRR